jgi:hypothetical protein
LKQDLSRYSANILCADASVAGLVEGLGRAVARCGDTATTLRAYESDGLSRSWHDSLASVLRFLD